MGGKYSKVVNPYFPALKVLEGMSLAAIKAKITAIAQSQGKSGVYFLSKSDVAWSLERLNEIHLYQILSLFDISKNGNIPSLDFWGALVLLSADDNDSKINNCFKLMDLNRDEYLSYNDLVMAMVCMTRGVANIRGYRKMPFDFIDKMVVEIFRVCKKSLNEAGEISMLDFRTVLLSDDLVGQYLSNLGVPVAEVDAAALVTKRSNLLKEAMIIRSKISETLCALAEHHEQEEQYGEGRGGDVDLVRLSEEDLLANQQRIALAIEAELRQKRIEKGLPPEPVPFNAPVISSRPVSSQSNILPISTSTMTTSSTSNAIVPNTGNAPLTTKPNSKMASKLTSTIQANRPNPAPTILAPEHPARKYLKGDNSVFVDADMSPDKKAAHGYFGEGFRTGLLEVWKKLPQDEDLMAELDAHTVIALFDNVTVTLTYTDAMHCLQHLQSRRSSILRYHFDDVLKWFLLYGIDLSVKTVRRTSVAAVRGGDTLSQSSLGAQMVPINPTSERDKWTEFTHFLSTQYATYTTLLSEGVRRAAYLRRVLDGIDQLVPNRTLKYGNFAHPERAALALTASSKNNRTMGAGGGSIDVNFMQKLVEFRKILSRKPSTVIMKYVFNHPNVKVLPKTLPGTNDNSTGENETGGSAVTERGRPGSRGRNNARGVAANSRSRSRGRSPAKSPSNSRPNSQGEQALDQTHALSSPSTKANTTANAATSAPVTTTIPGKNNTATTPGNKASGAPLIGPQLSEAEQLPACKTIRIEEIDDWKLTFKFALTSNPFSNLATKRSKENSRVKHLAGRFYIEDFANLQAQDLLDYYNLQQEKWLEAKIQAEEEQAAAELAALAAFNGEDPAALSAKAARSNSFNLSGMFGNNSNNNTKKKQKPEPKVFHSVVWFCIQLKTHLVPEQEALFVSALKNFFLSVPLHLRESLYNEVYIQIFAVFKSDNTGTANKASERVAGKFLSSMLGKSDADSTAEADAVFLSAPRVILVGLYHTVDHFQELEKQLVNSDVFLTRAVSSAVLDIQFMQSLNELMERAGQYAYYSEKLFGPQEDELGEERMNPLTFAKEMRSLRRHFADLAQNANTFNRAELSQHCRELGLKDTGTLAELVKRVREGYEEQADLVGYGELSKFGEKLVAKIFHMFKVAPIYRSDEDGGLSLWEFNKLLYHINAPTLYDPVQYQRLVKELDLLVDRDLRLRLAGLQAYYRSNGRLKQENDLFGVGSLDEHLSGRFLFASTFEPDALASLLNLLGANSLFIPELLKVLTRISTIKEFKVESELDRLSDFFKMLDLDAGKYLNKEVLLNPGWLGRVFNDLSAHLSDGDNGVLPAMRAHVRAHFGQYDQWESLLQHELVHRVQRMREGDERIAELRALQHTQNLRLQRRAEREREAAERQRMMDLINQGGSAAGDASVGAESESNAGASISLAGSAAQHSQPQSQHSPQSFPNQNHHADLDDEEEAEWLLEGENEEDEGEFEVIDYDAQIDALLLEDQTKVIEEELPPVPKNDVDLPKLILQLKEDLIFLHNIRNLSSVELSLDESNAIFARKGLLISKIAQAQRMIDENDALLAAHSCVVYDSFRLLAVGLSSAGLGSRDFCFRGYADGLDIAQYLPRGMGELAPAKQAQAEKTERAAQRKASALAALEREKRRRNMTDEEKEELLREQRAAQLLAWAKEENEMFSTAFAALCHAREERKSTAEIGQMVALWEALVVAKEKRYPAELATAVCQNNLACILLEFYGTRHPKGAPGQYLLEAAVNILSTILEELENEVEEAKEKADIRNWPSSPKKITSPKPTTGSSTATSFALSAETEVPPRDPVASIQEIALQCMLITVNYLTTLIETESTGKLQQSLRIKQRLYDMYNNLSEKDQEKLAQGVVPVVAGMPVFAYVKVRATLTKVVDEMEQYLETRAKRAAAEAEEELRRRLEEEEALRLESSVHEGSVKSLDPKIARREKKAKYAAQRKLDALKRVEVTKQRQALYEMIQTDRITTIFNARAHGAEASNTPGWGTENEQEMTRLSDEMNALTATLVGESAPPAAIHAGSTNNTGSRTINTSTATPAAAALPAVQESP